jgi:hypothetical protein
MNYVLQGLGAFLGVLAGTFVTFGVNLLMERRADAQKFKNLKFELGFNLRQIERWLVDVAGYRSALNGNALNTWSAWFDFANIMRYTAEDMFKSGKIYDHLDHEQIGKLQVFLSEFSSAFEQFINTKIAGFRQTFNQQEAIQLAVYMESKLRENKRVFEACIQKLG